MIFPLSILHLEKIFQIEYFYVVDLVRSIFHLEFETPYIIWNNLEEKLYICALGIPLIWIEDIIGLIEKILY